MVFNNTSVQFHWKATGFVDALDKTGKTKKFLRQADWVVEKANRSHPLRTEPGGGPGRGADAV